MNGRATIAGVSGWRLWFALLGGAVAWTGHLMLAYAISEFGCTAGLGRRSFIGVSVVSWMLLLLSVAMAALAAWALLVARDVGRRADEGIPHPDEESTAGEVARLGSIANGLFLFIVLIQTVPIFFFLGRC